MVAVTDQHDLYGLSLERFVPARGSVAKALRKEGRREQAAEVLSLRKPSVAAWAVNQLIRTRGREIAALFDAGDALQLAQSQLLAGRGDGRALREAVARERDAVSGLAELARGLLSSEGHELTQTMLDRVSQTLHAAALDADARAQVRDGCLVRELRHVGLGQLGISSQPASPRSGRIQTGGQRGADDRGMTPAAVSTTRPSRPDAGRRAAAKRTERERDQRLKLARKAEADAYRCAERAERELRTAQVRRDDAAESLRRAEVALSAARERAERAILERERAAQTLDRL
jgi:hypothetical protein